MEFHETVAGLNPVATNCPIHPSFIVILTPPTATGGGGQFTTIELKIS